MTTVIKQFPSGAIIGGIFQLEDGSEFSGSLIPITGGKGSLGKVEKPFKDAFLSSGSLHIDGRRAVYFDETDGRLVFGGPDNEDVLINASGSGKVIITNDLDLPSGSISASVMRIRELVSPTGAPITGSMFGTASFAESAGASPSLIPFNTVIDGPVVINQIGSAVEELFAGARTKFDLTAFTEAELVVAITKDLPDNSASLGIQFSLNEATWSFLDGATGPNAKLDSVRTATSSFQPITGSAKTDVFLRLVAFSGSGQAAAKVGNIHLVVK